MLRNEKVAFGQMVVKKSVDLSSALICSCSGLKAQQINALRLTIRRSGGFVQMGSNRVISKALEQTKFQYITDHLKGTNFVVFFDDSMDIIGIINSVNEEIKRHKGKIEFKCCNLNGLNLDVNFFKQVAKIKTTEQLRQAFVNSLFLSAQYLQAMLAKPARDLAIAMESYYKSKEGN